MTGNENANCDQSEPNETRFILARIKIKPNIYRELKELGLDVNVVVNKLLENFIVAYKAFWDTYRTPGVGFEPTRAKPIGLADPRRLELIPNDVNKSLTEIVFPEITISEDDVQEYLVLKKGLRARTLEDYRFVIGHFVKFISGKLTKDKMLKYIEYLQGLTKRRYRANKVKDFLEFLSKLKAEDLSGYCKLLEEVKPPKQEKQLFADEGDELYTLTLDDIHETLKQILEMGHGGKKGVLRDISCVVFLATTGMRVEEATWKTLKGTKLPGITKSLINLDSEYFILPAHLTKTHAKRVIPLHPDAKLCLQAYFKLSEEDLWNYDTVRKVISKTPLRELRRLRKFFTKKCKELGFDQLKRIAIQGHDEDELLKLKVTPEFYERYTPSEICREYFDKWGKVSILPDEVRNFIKKII